MRVFLVMGIASLLFGMYQYYFAGIKGLIKLEIGKSNNLILRVGEAGEISQQKDQMGLTITLDSVVIRQYTPTYEITLWKLNKADTTLSAKSHGSGYTFIERFSSEPMEIRQIEKTDFYFRLKAFYPNFEFAYQYPEDRDTIAAHDPGITIELTTNEGNPIVTLQSEPPSKRHLKDIVGLGAALSFYQAISLDSIKAISVRGNPGEDRIILTGSDRKMYHLLDGLIEEKPFEENIFYPMPGHDSVGFKVLFCFPDVAYLKAVPSTKGDEPLNPVANIEIWKAGQGAVDAFIYPETNVRKGGDFGIPGSDYKLGLRINPEQRVHYSDCHISIRDASSKIVESLTFHSGERKSYQNLRFQPVDCNDQYPKHLTLEVTKRNSFLPVFFGFLFLGIALFLLFIGKSHKGV